MNWYRLENEMKIRQMELQEFIGKESRGKGINHKDPKRFKIGFGQRVMNRLSGFFRKMAVTSKF